VSSIVLHSPGLLVPWTFGSIYSKIIVSTIVLPIHTICAMHARVMALVTGLSFPRGHHVQKYENARSCAHPKSAKQYRVIQPGYSGVSIGCCSQDGSEYERSNRRPFAQLAYEAVRQT